MLRGDILSVRMRKEHDGTDRRKPLSPLMSPGKLMIPTCSPEHIIVRDRTFHLTSSTSRSEKPALSTSSFGKLLTTGTLYDAADEPESDMLIDGGNALIQAAEYAQEQDREERFLQHAAGRRALAGDGSLVAGHIRRVLWANMKVPKQT